MDLNRIGWSAFFAEGFQTFSEAGFEPARVAVEHRGGYELYAVRDELTAEVSGKFSTHLLDPAFDRASFLAWTPEWKTVIGYRWNRADFPWIGVWEENRSRATPPWNGETITRGMEFGVSPIPESRREMIDRGSLFGVPGYRWIPARSTVTVHYEAFAHRAEALPA